MEIFTVAKDPELYHAWPDVAMTKSGGLVCVFTECNHHLDRDHSRIMVTRSGDRGRTWSQKSPLSDMRMKSEPYWNNARIIRLKDGRMLAMCDLMDGRNPYERYIYLWFGDEEGENWQEPVNIGCAGYLPDRILQITDRHWLLTTQIIDREKDSWEIYCYHSYDGGETWSEGILSAVQKGVRICEPSVVMAESGALVMLLRENSGRGINGYKCISNDGGYSWSPICQMPLPGCHRPVCARLLDGRYMVSFRMHQGGGGWGNGMQNTFIAVTDETSLLEQDYGKQWTRIRPLDYDPNPNADTGYTGWVQWEEGTIYMVNYIMDDADKAQIRGYRFDESIFAVGLYSSGSGSRG